MPDRSRRVQADDREFAHARHEASAQPEPETKDPAAVALGRKGGLKGGPARAEKLTPARRSEIARKAAAARWERGGS